MKLEFSRGGKTILTPLPLLPNFRRKEPTMLNNQNELILLQDLGMVYATDKSKAKRRYGIYKCGYCGTEFKASTANVKIGYTKSCGCYQKIMASKAKTTHGLSRNKIYSNWKEMKRRVFDKKSTSFNEYGGRGITMCDRWLNIENFIEDMYPTFADGLTIDRINPNGNYEPSNCRWATKETQSRNTRLIYSTNTSGFRGVSFDKSRRKFIAQIGIGAKNKHLGAFDTGLEAAKAYDKYVIENNLEHTINNV